MKKILVIILLSILFVTAAYAEHTADVSLEPEWSPAGETITYGMEICNDGPHAIDEVRIFDNPSYQNFQCMDLPGWELTFVPNFPDPPGPNVDMCWYYTNTTYAIPDGQCKTFEFEATVPASGCEFSWKIETRDEHETGAGNYNTWTDTTSVDDHSPEITKTITGCSEGDCPPGPGDECWITQYTEIEISVTDQGICEPPSGLDFCRITYSLDGGPYMLIRYEDLDGEVEWTYDFNFEEDSLHILNITCLDNAGNMISDIEEFHVDTEPPETEKEYGNPYYLENDIEWINTDTPITLTSEDGGDICAIGVDKTWYIDVIVPDSWCEQEYLCEPKCESPYDCEGKRCINDCQDWCIDNWASQGYSDWEDCVSDCAHEECDVPYCFDKYNVPHRWELYDDPFYKQEESCHLIQFFSADHLSNLETMNWQCVFVDDTPPEGNKYVGDPKVQCSPEENCSYWVRDHVTEIRLECIDPDPHPVNHEEVCYKVSYDLPVWQDITDQYCPESLDNGWCCLNDEATLVFEEDSMHDLEYFCRDKLGNENTPDLEYFRVDSRPPVITKSLIGPTVGDCPPDIGDLCWIKDDECGEGTIIHVEATDDETYGCAVDQVMCSWWYYLDSYYHQGQMEIMAPFNITFDEETEHELHISCCDALGNCVDDNETFYVDSSGPIIEKVFLGPFYESGEIEWIDTASSIGLNATDQPGEPCRSGVDKIYYRYEIVDDMYCNNPSGYCYPSHNSDDPGWIEYLTYIGGFEESCHMMEYYAVDMLGNIGEISANCFFVDKTGPVPNVNIGDPKIACETGEECDYWVRDHVTLITLGCDNEIDEPHPAPLDKLEWRIKIDDNPWSDWQSTDSTQMYEFTFPEDSKHILQVKCNDSVSKESDIIEYVFKVDSIPPNTTKNYIGPYYENQSIKWIDSATEVLLETIDGGEICAVGVDKMYYRTINLPDPYDWHYCEEDCMNWNPYHIDPWNTYESQFNDLEECCNIIEYYSVDRLGNQEEIRWQCIFADKSSPVINKTYSMPYFTENGYEWISNTTVVSLESYDPEPHPSGVKEHEYRITLVDDERCMDQDLCDDATGSGIWSTGNSFSILEESCHLIEIRAIDNVDKESYHKQCVFVDNSEPLPNKTVGEPKGRWDGTDSYFYPYIKDLCWNGESDEIECWKITMTTPISLECTDQEPHPVDHEKVCFNVELDAEDRSSEYCEFYSGEFNATGDGFCCLDSEMDDFLFKEESEHNLKYYCIDALGNKGPVDEEKFKVDGTRFDINLYKKWNLISVPFMLLNSDPDEVFKNLQDVDSVWTYDSETGEWLYWFPDNETADTITDIIPGWGYWILEKEDHELLTIGGSLMQPGKMPPARKIYPGWNLIGYYGTSWALYPMMEDYDYMCGDYWEPEERYVYGDKVYCALNSLVDTQEGYPRWSSLWSYINCGNHVAGWVGLNACVNGTQGELDRMYAGRGYWIEVDVDEIYAPATTCIWNDDFECQWTGGGILP